MRVVRAAWLGAAGLSLALFLLALPARQRQLASLEPAVLPSGWSTDSLRAALERAGLSSAYFAFHQLAFESLLAAACGVAGSLIAWRRPEDGLAQLAAYSLLLAGVGLLPLGPALAGEYPASLSLVLTLRALALAALLAVFFVFPDRRFYPSWAGWLLAAWCAYQLGGLARPALALPLNWHAGSEAELILAWHGAWLAAGVLAQFGRLRHAAGPVERQQSKWLLLGACAAGAGAAAFGLPLWVLPLDRLPGALGILYTLASTPAVALSLLLWPLALALATLKWQLADADFAISRALVYGPLLAALGLAFGLVLAGLSSLAPGEPVLTFAVAAVLAGLLLRPLRGWLRHLVDRRLYDIQIDYGTPPALAGADLTQNRLGQYTRLQPMLVNQLGSTYKAQHPTLGVPVTIQVLPVRLSADPHFVARFRLELAAAQLLEHPNLARVYDAGQADGRLYVASEYLTGQDLSSFLLINGRLAVSRALPILQELARGLDYLHARGQVHGDVRQANVMLVLRETEHVERDARFPARVAFLPTSAFRTVLLNVGLARALNTGHRAEALGYAAPEQIRARLVDGRADIYSLGVLAYQMLAGRLPFQHLNPGAMLIAHLRQPPPDPRGRVPSLSAETAAALLRALAKDPRERFGTAGEFVAQLQ